DQGAMRLDVPILGQRAFREPLQPLIAVTVSALVADNVHPLLVFELVLNPVTPLRVHDHWRVSDVAEDRAANPLPLLGLRAEVLSVASKNPRHVIRLPARHHVTCE